MLAVLLTLAACGADSNTTETVDDSTDDAPESLADAGTEGDEPTVEVTTTPSTSTTVAQTVTTSDGVSELSTINFVDEANNVREPTPDEIELATLILEDLNSLSYQWESGDVVVESPTEQTGDITTVLTYVATAWTTIEDQDGSENRTGARVVYDMIVRNEVTTADGVVLDQAIVNDCFTLDLCPDGVSRDTVTIERIVSFDRTDLFADCLGRTAADGDGSTTVDCS